MSKLRVWRMERGLSQIELAEASGVTRWAIHLCEAAVRRPNHDDQLKLAGTLNVQMHELFPEHTDESKVDKNRLSSVKSPLK